MESHYIVKTGQFEGPLDLLLDLIEKRKLHINDISLAKVTDDYISYVQKLQEQSIGGIAHFILVASTLLLIKSKSLLPNMSLSEEEKADVAELEERLRLYQRIKELSVHVRDRFGKKFIFMRNPGSFREPIFSPDKETNPKTLLSSIKRVLESIPVKELVPKAIVKKIITLEEMIDRLVGRVQENLRLSFREFTKGSKERTDVIVGFLALLELVKQGIVSVTQDNHYQDITIESNALGTPNYS